MAFIEDKNEEAPPFNPVIGFIIILAGIAVAYFLSRPLHNYLTSSSLVLAGNMTVLPIEFPPEWPFWARQASVGFVIFLVFFIFFMIGVAIFSGATGVQDPRDVNLADIRKRKEKEMKR